MSMNKQSQRDPFFAGQILATRGVAELMAVNTDFASFVQQSLVRHLGGDWGDLDSEDKASNEDALMDDQRLLSAYNDERFPKNGVATIWIITEADRRATTILFPDEY